MADIDALAELKYIRSVVDDVRELLKEQNGRVRRAEQDIALLKQWQIGVEKRDRTLWELLSPVVQSFLIGGFGALVAVVVSHIVK